MYTIYTYIYIVYIYTPYAFISNFDDKNVTDVGEVLSSCIIYSEEQIDVLLEHALTGSTKGMQWTNML